MKGHTVRTDQPHPYGGDSAAAPFDLFIASIATCMGFYALRFCQERGIATEGLGLSVETVRDEARRSGSRRSRSALAVPSGFPEKYARRYGVRSTSARSRSTSSSRRRSR